MESAARVVTKTESRSLPVKLTDAVLRDRGDALAAVIQDLKAEEDRQVDAKTQMKARLTELDAKKTQLAITISRREEYQEVMVDIYHDFDRRVVETVRRDTGATIHERPMRDDELQVPLPV